MNELKATPGPYEIQEYTNYIGWSICAPNTGCIAERWYSHTNFRMKDDLEVQMRANAHLLAASWDLYHALAEIARPHKCTPQQFKAYAQDIASKAMAKARGEQ